MKYRISILLLLLASVYFLTGCAGQADLRVSNEPMQIFYDILYADDSAIRVDLMIVGNTSNRSLIIEEELEAAIDQVSREIPKSRLIKHQDIFRDRLEEILCDGLKKDPVRVVILDMNHVAATMDKSSLSLR